MVLKNLEILEVSKWAGIAYRWAGIEDWTVLYLVKSVNKRVNTYNTFSLYSASVKLIQCQNDTYIK